MDSDIKGKRPSYVHKVSDMLLLDSKEDYYSSSANVTPNSGKHLNKHIPYKKLVVPSAMRSIYWKCYGFPANEANEIITRNVIVCLLCKNQMIYNRNTSNLRMHLHNKHKIELETLEMVQPAPSCKSGRADQRSVRSAVNKRKRNSSIHNNTSMVESVQIQMEQNDTSATEQVQFLQEMDEITPLQAIVKEVTTDQAYTLDDGKLIADAIAEFVILDLQSPEIVEGKGFQRLIATLKSPCEIPSKNRLMEEFLPKIYDSVKEQLQPELGRITGDFSLSVEDWEASSGDVYSTVSIHYANMDDGELQTKILTNIFCSEVDALHWGAQWDGLIEEWGISNSRVKAVIVASDREDVYDSLVARQYSVVPCLAHTLQNAMMEVCFGKAEVVSVVKKCRALIALIHSNPAVLAILRENEGLIECEKGGGLQTDNPPLWSSTFTMLEQIMVWKDLLGPFYDSLSTLGYPTETLRLTGADWSIINDITDVLSPFKVAMLTLYEERIPLISFLKPLIQQLTNVHLEKSTFDTKFTSDLKSVLSSVLSARYKDPKMDELLDMSCALDPRFKGLPFVESSYKGAIKERLKEMMAGVALQASSSESGKGEPVSKKPRLSGMEYLLGDLCVKSEMPSDQRLNLEIVQFECESPIGLEVSPIQYWKANQSKFPNISKIAMQFLCVPVCVNNHLNSHYNSKATKLSLTPQLAHKLRFLHQNNLSQ